MKNLVGLLEPTEGEVLYDERNFSRMGKKGKALMRREMGMVFQGSALFDSLTVLENVMFPLDMFSDDGYKMRKRTAMQCLERVNVADAAEKVAEGISGGMHKSGGMSGAMSMKRG